MSGRGKSRTPARIGGGSGGASSQCSATAIRRQRRSKTSMRADHDRANGIAPRGAPLHQDLAGAVAQAGGARLLRARRRSGAWHHQPRRQGRSAVWTEGQVVRLAKRAWRDGYHGLAAVIAFVWSSQQSPGDVRTLAISHRRRGSCVLHRPREGPASRSAAR
jgi:hypothetical protein